MNRREFAARIGANSAAISALSMLPAGVFVWPRKGAAQAPSDEPLVTHCRTILEQNLLKTGERFVVATGYIYDEEWVRALLQAGSDLGAVAMHVPVFPKVDKQRLSSGLTPEHWELYAETDFLLTTSLGRPQGIPGPSTSYITKIGNHGYRTDMEYIHRPGSKTRWLDISFSLNTQKRLFPNAERRARALKNVKILHDARELRIVSRAGSDFVCRKEGRSGHCQYGIADVPGRWDNFGTGCINCSPIETSAEGKLVFEPGDIFLDLEPKVLPAGEPVELTFGGGGNITRVDGGRMAGWLEKLLESYDHPDATKMSHVGWGIHEATRLNKVEGREVTGENIYTYHHNNAGSTMISLGRNLGFGVGGPETNYAGLGGGMNAAPNHTHFSFHGKVDFYCDDQKICEDGKLLVL